MRGTTNIHTHTQDEINIGENVELRTYIYINIESFDFIVLLIF